MSLLSISIRCFFDGDDDGDDNDDDIIMIFAMMKSDEME